MMMHKFRVCPRNLTTPSPVFWRMVLPPETVASYFRSITCAKEIPRATSTRSLYSRINT